MLATCLEKSGAGIECYWLHLTSRRLLADFEPLVPIVRVCYALLRGKTKTSLCYSYFSVCRALLLLSTLKFFEQIKIFPYMQQGCYNLVVVSRVFACGVHYLENRCVVSIVHA